MINASQKGLLAAVALLVVSCFVLWKDVPVRQNEVLDHAMVLRFPATPADLYTYVPQSMTADEVRALYPSHLKLRLLQVVHRHGERTPTTSHFKSLQQHRHGWRLCHSPAVQAEFFLSANNTRPAHFQVLPLNSDGFPSHDPAGACRYGQLTDKGKRSLFRVGVYLRHLYIHHLDFLPDMWSSLEQVYIRATDIVRTHHSVLSLLLGLYPMSLRTAGLPAPEIHTMPSGKEFLYPNDGCPMQRQLWQRSLLSDKGFPAEVERLRTSFPEIRPWLDEHPPPQDPNAWHVSALQAAEDTFTSLVAHSLPLPKGITLSLVEELRRVTTREQYVPFQGAEKLDRLAAGLLLRDIDSRIAAVLAGDIDPTLIIYSAHDSTVGPLLAALQVFDGVWPPFASTVIFELFSDTRDSQAFYIRVVYNGKPLSLPFCPESHSLPHFCPLGTFEKHLNKMKLTMLEYRNQCQP